MREQRLVFGEAAELYDRARAGYPEQLVDDVLHHTPGAGSFARAVEVGAGTGKATVAFAARGIEIVALEPSAEMAAVARRHCGRFPQVRIEVTSFEDWPVEANAFDLVFSAQAWHWVRPDVRYRKAAEALRPGGTLALFWHRTRWSGEALRDELEQLYRRLVPELYAQAPGFPGLTPPRGDDTLVDEIAASGLFEHATPRTYPWSVTFTADSFVELLLTQSKSPSPSPGSASRALRRRPPAHRQFRRPGRGPSRNLPHVGQPAATHSAGHGTVSSDWGARTYGEPCRECAYSWTIEISDAVSLVAEMPAQMAVLVAGARGDERHPALAWSAACYVVHVADNLRIWAERLAGIALGGSTIVGGYDDNRLAAARGYDAVSLPAALWSLQRAVGDWTDAVKMAPPDLVMVHPERGRIGLDDVVRTNAHDAAHHAWDIRRSLSAIP